MHAAISNGPQTGYAAVVEGTAFRSTERRPADALADLNTQINLANAGRRRAGLEPLQAPRHIAQLVPVYAHANPHLDALLAGEPAPVAHVSCSSNSMPIGDIRTKVTGALNRMASGYSPRTAA
jgi:hypothetical protein